MAASAKIRKLEPGAVRQNEKRVRNQVSRGEPFNRSQALGHVKGSIVRLKMENFMIYDNCQFQPGPHLNVLIGPNGTGKSTIVCAICLVLAGKTSLLGRSKEVGEYVKYGHNSAVLEVELCNPAEGNTVIRREITRQGNTSTWRVNGRVTTLREVEETVKNHDIQLANLCQFLPQDKVAEFAKMSKEDLLENTEKSVGQPELYEYHQKLKDSRKKEIALIKAHRDDKELLDKLKQKNSRLESDVRRFEERERHLDTIKILEQKRPFIEYINALERFNSLKEQVKEVRANFDRVKAENAPLQSRITALMTRITELDTELKEKSNEIRSLANSAKAKNGSIEKLVDDMIQVQDELKEKKEEEEKRKKKVNDWKKQLEGWQRELEEMGEEDNVKPELDEIARNCKDIYNKIQLIDTEIEMLAKDRSDFKKAIKSHRDELKKLSDLKDQRLRALKQRNKDTYNAVEWLRANKHMFKATIHEPMALVIDMLNRQHAKYIEMHISGNDLRAFVCEDAEDMEKFLAEVRDKQNLRVNAVKSPRQAPSEYQPQRPIEELRRWGFECYLRDLFEAPDAVMAYLCKQYRVHDVPLGNEKTQKHVSRVIAESGQRTFYTPEYQYVVRRSKYGNKTTSSRSTAVGAAQLLYVSIDPNQTRELEQQLQEAENRLRQGEEKFLRLKRDRQTLSEEDNAWRERKKELQKKRDRRRTVVQNIKAKHDSIAKSESEALDLQREEHKAEQEIAKINKKKMTVVLQLKNAIQSCLEANKHKVRIALVVALVFAEKNRMEGQFREGNQLQQTLKAEHGRLSELKSQAKDKARRLLNIAKERSKLGQNEDIPPALKEVFDRFPSTIEEIDDMIHNEKARADCVFETNREVVDDYNNRKKEIAKLSSEVEKKRQLVERHQQEIAEVKDKWLAPLQELMAQISDRFSYFFKCLGCAGEVDLYKGENEEDYDKYGIRIRVKFRKTENLRELTSHYQSGGERSVSTILYMMALQELNRCPFRVVDEINQGMDHNNERKVFELVVQTACKDSTSQYFLITPKLLPNLSYGAKMTVLCVYNGHWMMPHSQWNLKKFCEKRRRLAIS